MKISIITVTYNAETTIERTLASVASQTYDDIEHIVVDGASKDETMKIVSYFHNEIFSGKKKEQAQSVSEKDKGLYDAMNKGIRIATGDYLVFLNAGDKLHDATVIERVVEAAEDTNMPSVVYGDTAIVDNDGKFLQLRRLRPSKQLSWKSFKWGMLVCHQSFYMKRDMAEEYDLSYRFSADFDWCIRCMKKGGKMAFVNAPLADYLSEGMTTANHKASLKERFSIMVKHYGWLTAVGVHAWFVMRSPLLASPRRGGK